RFFFSMTLNLPLTLAALISGLAVLALVRLFDFPFPPACAMALLAMLIPEEAVLPYPAEVFAGITALTSASLLWKKFSAYRK
ncbi:MAG: hypothetical protein IJ727_01925, partial [Treponema sp.]|nr:hypothetical protein [Treponema sp.]